ncbi:chemotaxis protein CheA [Archangium sp.]|uniref:chemotaxis protein CheA n=1 Tax=Archangium sp. TaxID=1872627 RepID=UPI002D5500BB|nr:chemotaxis protein CheA [Archangium sp.]HYO60130.1 chemotaxis protein CheA [Archangium sp.]
MEFNLQALMDVFTEEAEDILSTLEESLLTLESHTDDEEHLHALQRATHTLKGNAVTLHLPGITQAAHVLEDVLEGLVTRKLEITPELGSRMLRVVDMLHTLVEAARAGQKELSPAQQAVVAALTQWAQASARATSPAPSQTVESPAPAAEAPAPTAPSRGRTLRVEAEKLDRLLDLVGELTIARGRLTQFLAEHAEREPVAQEALDVQREADRLYLELQERVMKARMVPVGPFFRQYQRSVRELAASCGKQARLVIEGADVEVDTSMVERLRDPLMHMIRNAVDHGIESPEVREARGKEPCGQLVLRAFHDAGNLRVELSDDGGGIRRDKLRERAKELVDDPEKLEDAELLRLIFEPGFTTAEAVTDLSGRGVGMDVVRRNVEALRGSVDLESQEGRGTTVRLRMPLTLAIIEGFLVEAAGEVYVLPLDAVLECVELPAEERGRQGAHGLINLRGSPVPYLRLRHRYSLRGPPAVRENVVILEQSGRRAGLVVDALLGESQAVIKPLGPLFQGLPGVSGSTILGSGRVSLILDVAALLRETMSREPSRPVAPPAAA